MYKRRQLAYSYTAGTDVCQDLLPILKTSTVVARILPQSMQYDLLVPINCVP